MENRIMATQTQMQKSLGIPEIRAEQDQREGAGSLTCPSPRTRQEVALLREVVPLVPSMPVPESVMVLK